MASPFNIDCLLALFHLLVQEAAQRWTGSQASRLGLERTFKHDRMKDVSRVVSTGSWRGWSTPQLPVPAELREHGQIVYRFAGGPPSGRLQ